MVRPALALTLAVLAGAVAASPSPALLEFGAHRAAAQAGEQATHKASAFMRATAGQPQQDDLNELKTENPMAFAIVQALLMKRQMGLLDPRHPSASFVPAKSVGPTEEQKAALANMESQVVRRAPPLAASAEDAAYAAPAAPARHGDWLNWKPAQEEDDDAVKQLTGADVAPAPEQGSLLSKAQRVGAGGSAAFGSVVSGLAADAAVLGMDAQTLAVPTATAAKQASRSSGWASVSAGLTSGVATPPAAAEDTRSVPAVGLAQKPAEEANPLASFSWVGSDAPEVHTASAAQTNSYLTSVDWKADGPAGEQPAHVPKPTASLVSKSNALGSWLSSPLEN